MGDLVNLRAARKARARAEQAAAAAVNRAVHGRSKQQKQAERLDRDRQARALDGAKVEEPR